MDISAPLKLNTNPENIPAQAGIHFFTGCGFLPSQECFVFFSPNLFLTERYELQAPTENLLTTINGRISFFLNPYSPFHFSC